MRGVCGATSSTASETGIASRLAGVARSRTSPTSDGAQLLHGHEPGRAAADRRQVARKPRQRGIEQPRHSLEGRRCQLGVCDREPVEGERERRRVEVRGGRHPPVGEDDGAVGGPGELDFDFPPSLRERVQGHSDHLRQTAEGERILNPSGRGVTERAAVEKAAEERRCVLLPRRRTQSRDLRVENRDVRAESLAGERCCVAEKSMSRAASASVRAACPIDTALVLHNA